MSAVLVRLNAPLAARIARAAKRAKKNKSQFIRDVLEDRLAKTNDASFAALAADLAGSVGGKKDASTNPKYLRGYGE